MAAQNMAGNIREKVVNPVVINWLLRPLILARPTVAMHSLSSTNMKRSARKFPPTTGRPVPGLWSP